MAQVTKHTHRAAFSIFHHNERISKNPSNKDIDSERTPLNYSLRLPPKMIKDGSRLRAMTTAERYQDRLKGLHKYNRADVKLLISWLFTAPKELPQQQQEAFFRACLQFVAVRYGGWQNLIGNWIHLDEKTAHMHVCIIPAVADKKHGGEKVNASAVINRAELRAFHPDLQEYLTKSGINVRVLTGITKKQGGNQKIKQLKERVHKAEHMQERERGIEYER